MTRSGVVSHANCAAFVASVPGARRNIISHLPSCRCFKRVTSGPLFEMRGPLSAVRRDRRHRIMMLIRECCARERHEYEFSVALHGRDFSIPAAQLRGPRTRARQEDDPATHGSRCVGDVWLKASSARLKGNHAQHDNGACKAGNSTRSFVRPTLHRNGQ